jgi:hypothetical protein
MNNRDALTLTSRERLREEIAKQTEIFLRTGGRIEHLHIAQVVVRPIGPVWWNARGGSGNMLSQV